MKMLEIRGFCEFGLADSECREWQSKMMKCLLMRLLGIGCVDKNVISGLSRQKC